ncbi:T9SS type A sorting domain-containing protein [Balneola sp. MJW-20]|uniref:T9SS type A sorting domain-containing protein n=1 Tax=Gracilimonas aurantiaca TaxID=3234185 RepID=UPI0034679E0E
MKKSLFLFSALLISSSLYAQRLPISGVYSGAEQSNQNVVPVLLDQDLTLTAINTVNPFTVRLAYDPVGDRLLMLQNNGDVFEVSTVSNAKFIRYTSADHGLSEVFGMDVDSRGNLYLVGNDRQGNLNQGQIAKGTRISNSSANWALVAETEPYPLSNTAFDHTFNGVAVSPDDQYLFVNSGSRTDHGEIQTANGAFPGLRESPVTSAILRIPADSVNLYIEDDSTFLADNGYLFADGVRNNFDLTFDAEGRLFGTENSGDRDDSEELNWLREGLHYGFPWRMGGNDTPMQFEGYDPESDLLVNQSSTAYQGGFFYNDPDYPEPPAGLVFTEPVINEGPDADLYRDPQTGDILDASDQGETLSTFTSHRSPLGLVFDTESALGGNYNGDAFVLSWTGTESSLLSGMQDTGEDIMHLEMTVNEETGEVRSAVTRIASGFTNPIDAELIGNSLYVLEFVFSGEGRLYKIEFPSFTSSEEEQGPSVFALIQNYPNPFNPTTTIPFELEKAGVVRIEVIDIMGRVIQTLFQGPKNPGRHEVVFDASELSSGIYFYRLNFQDQSMLKKMMLIK